MLKLTGMVAALLAVAGVLAPVSEVAAQERVVVEERTAVVLKVVGRTVIIRNDKGEIKKYTEIPKDVKLYVGGKLAKISDLKEGMRLHGIRWENVPAPVIVTYEEVRKMEASKPAPAPRRQRAPAAYSRPAQLPSTGSSLPLVGLAGLMLVLIGGTLALLRRRLV